MSFRQPLSIVLTAALALVCAWLVGPVCASATEPHPALWHIKSGAGEIYLFGSIHLLPAGLDWQTGDVSRAASRAQVFVFEIPMDAASQARVASLIAAKGNLNNGVNLHDLLPPSARADLDADAAAVGLQPQALDRLRPWLADLTLLAAQLAHEKASPDSGADAVLARQAEDTHKELRYLETVDDQIALIVPSDLKLEVSEFIADLKSFRTETDDYRPLLAAWMTGDTATLDRLLNGEFKGQPEAKEALIDRRNRNWLPKLKAMLAEPKVFFVTVGAGHLVGKGGLPALLRADGYAVEGAP